MLEIDLSVVIFAIVNFIILVALLRLFLYKPVLAMLDKRKQAIDQALDQAEATQKLSAQADEHLRQQMAAAHVEAEQIVERAKSQAEQAAQQIMEQARAQAEAQLAQTSRIIESERRHALEQLRSQIADLAIDAAQQVLAGSLTPQQQQALLDETAAAALRPAATQPQDVGFDAGDRP